MGTAIEGELTPVDEFASKQYKIQPFPEIQKVNCFPITHIAEIIEKKVEYLVADLLLVEDVGIVSGQPSALKTWLVSELAVSVSSGTSVFGQFETKKGKVICFNAEDNPYSVTRPRMTALANWKELNLQDLNLFLLDVPTLQLDKRDTQQQLSQTIKTEKPSLVIFDPLRPLHSLNEDKASDMAPLLDFLRSLQRNYGCAILLVCHDRKPSKEEGRRESMTRGSNVLEGWRDTAIYLDKMEDKIRVTVYHRGAQAPPPFFFRLQTDNSDGHLVRARLDYLSEQDTNTEKQDKTKKSVRETLKKHGKLTREELRAFVKVSKDLLLRVVKEMIANGELQEIQDVTDKKKKHIQFQNQKKENE